MNKILVTTTCYAPKNVIGAIRVTKLTKYMHKQGNEIYVLTVPLLANDKVDNTLDVIKSPDFHVEYSNYSYLIKSIYNLYKKPVATDKNTIGKNTFINSKTKLINTVKRYLKLIANYNLQKSFIRTASKGFKGIEFDIVLSTYPDLSSHLAALELKKRKVAKKWIADFRDPIAYNELNSKIEYKYNIYLQDKIIKSADIVTYVSKNMVKKLVVDGTPDNKFKYLPNGYDSDDIDFIKNFNNDRLDTKILNISYVGGLYNGKRDLSKLFKVIRYLIDSGDISSNKIRFHYAGKEFNVLKNQASKYKLEDILANKGFIAREDSLAIQNQSDIVVVSTWNTEKDEGVIPGKVYECFLLKKPTITVTNGTKSHSELGSMVKKARLGIELNAMLNDKDEEDKLRAFILEAYQAKTNGLKFEVEYNSEYINSFNYENITQQLIHLIEDIK